METIKVSNGVDDVGAYEARMKARDARKAAGKTAAEAYERTVMLALDDAEQEYGDDAVRRVDIAPGVCSVIIARTDALGLPVRALRTFQRSANARPTAKLQAAESVARIAMVWGDFAAVTKTYPAAAETICNAALTMAGAQAEEDAGK